MSGFGGSCKSCEVRCGVRALIAGCGGLKTVVEINVQMQLRTSLQLAWCNMPKMKQGYRVEGIVRPTWFHL